MTSIRKRLCQPKASAAIAGRRRMLARLVGARGRAALAGITVALGLAAVSAPPAFAASLTVSVSASPTTIKADGTSTTVITATVLTATNAPVPNDMVTFSLLDPTGPCQSLSPDGSMSPNFAVTSATGQRTSIYASSLTPAACVIVATEANTGASGSVTVTQTLAAAVAVAANPPSVQAATSTTSTVTATVTAPIGGAVAGDTVTFNTSGTCGTLSPTSTPTSSAGTATSTYTPSGSAGQCTITAVEATGGQSGTSTVTQSSNPPNTTAHLVAGTKKLSVPADGSTGATETYSVKLGKSAVANDIVFFTLKPSVPGSCGTIAPSAMTGRNGVTAPVTYTPSFTEGTCSIGATDEAYGQAAAAVLVTQLANTVNVVASPSFVPADNTTTTTVTATITNVQGAAVVGEPITFYSADNSCGRVNTPQSVTTNSSGVATATYTASTTSKWCMVHAQIPSLKHPAAEIDQRISPVPAGAPYTLALTASPTSVVANGTSTSTVTVTVTDSTGQGVGNDSVLLTTTPSCGILFKVAPFTSLANGQTTATYTSSKTVGSCLVTGTEAGTGATSSVSIAQT